jgi:hypothetical protein
MNRETQIRFIDPPFPCGAGLGSSDFGATILFAIRVYKAQTNVLKQTDFRILHNPKT